MRAKKREVSNAQVSQYSSSSHAVDTSEGKEQEKDHTQFSRASQQAVPELCACVPISTLGPPPGPDNEDGLFLEDEHLVLTTPHLNYVLRAQLNDLLPHATTLSVLLLHVSQLDHPALDSFDEQHLYRHRYHVTQNVLLQIVRNVRRATRNQDYFLLEEGVGAAALFPSVDEQGIQNIIERMYRSVCLLQAETIVPPLLRVTDIVLGYGTYTQQDESDPDLQQSIDELLASTGRVARRLLLRPALASSLWETMPQTELLPSSAFLAEPEPTFNDAPASTFENTHSVAQERLASLHTSNVSPQTAQQRQKRANQERRSSDEKPQASVVDSSSSDVPPTLATIPFLRLPSALSPRMKSLIPYAIARQFQCAPIGRNHHTLTVAMANPADKKAIQRLNEITGMTIFPVSCETEALDALLSEKW